MNAAHELDFSMYIYIMKMLIECCQLLRFCFVSFDSISNVCGKLSVSMSVFGRAFSVFLAFKIFHFPCLFHLSCVHRIEHQNKKPDGSFFYHYQHLQFKSCSYSFVNVKQTFINNCSVIQIAS